MWHADANLELRLGVHTFGLLQVRGVGPLDGSNHARIKIKPEVGWCAHFTGWTRPCGHETGLDAPAVQSGQVVKSLQILAMAAGTACLLLKSSSSELVGELQEAWLYAMLLSFSRLEALYSHLRSHRIGMSKRALFYVLPSCFELGMMVASYGMKKNGPCCAYLVLFFICSGYTMEDEFLSLAARVATLATQR